MPNPFTKSHISSFKRGLQATTHVTPIQTKIQHPTHSAWSERKGQWPRVLCATSPWEPRLLDHGAPVHCKFEGL